jgi:dienelactone hydrolase
MHTRDLCCLFCLLLPVSPAWSAEDSPVPAGPTLPGTELLELEEPLDVVMVRGINRFAERELLKAKEERNAPWLEHPADSEEGKAARAEARRSVREMIGMPPEFRSWPEEIPQGSIWSNPSQSAPRGTTKGFEVKSVRWDAFDGVSGTGLVSIPRTLPEDPETKVPLIVIIPDADQSPEQLFGLRPGIPESHQFARRLADCGCIVLCPLLIDREHTWSGHPEIRWTNMPHREYVYRLSFELGLHPVGYEVAKVLSGIGHLHYEYRKRQLYTFVFGIGEGGLIGMMATAIDEHLIDAAIIRGYFNERDRVWEEPIYRNLYGQLNQFGDAELASLIAPRWLLIDPGPVPEVDGPPLPDDRPHFAAPGVIRTPPLESVQREIAKAEAAYQEQEFGETAVGLVDARHPEDDGTEILEAIISLLWHEIPGFQFELAESVPYTETNPGQDDFIEHRMKSQLDELVHYSQRVLHSSDKVRAKSWNDLDMSSPEAFDQSAETYRQWVHESFIGKLPEPTAPLKPRSRQVIDEPTHVGYEVVLDVYPAEGSGGRSQGTGGVRNQGEPTANRQQPTADIPDWGVIAGGILLVPKDLEPGERRPVVVCQHGLEGTPMDTITTDPDERAFAPYQGFSTELVKRGFIVYAPQNPYKGFDEFRVIQRKSNPLGRSLFSYIIEQHRQTLSWLATLPYVDPERIAFYGLSYGGKTAVRVPPLLRTVRGSGVSDDGQSIGVGVNHGYCLSICSADFNDWIRKNVSHEDRYSYVYTREYEIFEWNMGHVANYAELSWLMVPRPFMVERGHDDGVAPDEWVAWEYAKVRRMYTKLGIPERTEIEFFDGPHAIHGVGTYRFLHRHLDWPEPEASGD